MAPAPTWVRSSTAITGSSVPTPTSLAQSATPPPAAPAPVAVLAAVVATEPPPVPPPPAPTVRSPDGRLTLTATSLTVLGQTFGLRELERAEVQPVRWLLWYLLGGLGLAIVLIFFLNNWLRTLPTMVGLLATALMLLYGHRGTNRLRLWRLGREAAHFALPGTIDSWRRLVDETNRRIGRTHDQAAAEAAAVLAALAAEQAATVEPTPDSLPPAPTFPAPAA